MSQPEHQGCLLSWHLSVFSNTICLLSRARKNVEFGNDIAWKFVSLPGNFGSQYKFRQVFLLCFVRSRAIKFVVYIQLCYGVCMDVRWWGIYFCFMEWIHLMYKTLPNPDSDYNNFKQSRCNLHIDFGLLVVFIKFTNEIWLFCAHCR